VEGKAQVGQQTGSGGETSWGVRTLQKDKPPDFTEIDLRAKGDKKGETLNCPSLLTRMDYTAHIGGRTSKAPGKREEASATSTSTESPGVM